MTTDQHTEFHDSSNTVKIHFTKREKECLKCLVLGMTAKEIAKNLNISDRTVECYLGRIKIKTNCHSRSMLIRKILDEYVRLEFCM